MPLVYKLTKGELQCQYNCILSQHGEVSLVRLRPVWMTNYPPSVLWHCWLGHQTCKNRRPYNLYCVGADVKPCSINQSISVKSHCWRQ